MEVSGQATLHTHHIASLMIVDRRCTNGTKFVSYATLAKMQPAIRRLWTMRVTTCEHVSTKKPLDLSCQPVVPGGWGSNSFPEPRIALIFVRTFMVFGYPLKNKIVLFSQK
jgi:hypothetical protein